jgi:dTMP kinase
MKTCFISFEGPDGAGKSTVIEKLRPKFDQLQTQYLVTREPGGSQIAEKIRKIILDPDNKQMSARTEALLYAAARSQHVEEVIKPALAAGKIVISDRYIDSSLVYQGVGRKLGIEPVQAINDFATAGLMPDLTLFFALAPEKGLARINHERPDHEDRLEQERLAFHQQVYAGYQQLLARDPERICVINADQDVDQVAAECWAVIMKKLKLQ